MSTILPAFSPKRLDSHSLANLIRENDYIVMFVDDVSLIVMIGVRCEKAAAYTLREAERIAFGEVRTQCHGWIR